jgi:hypothetical protein
VRHLEVPLEEGETRLHVRLSRPLRISSALLFFVLFTPRLVHSVVKGENPSYKAKNEASAQLSHAVPWYVLLRDSAH